MQHLEDQWTSADGLPLYAQRWAPEGEPKAVVCLIHGLGDHSGRYRHVAEALVRADYALLTFDLRGHGRSGGPRGHWQSFDLVMNDIGLLLTEAARRFPNRPRVLYGHSLGGSLALNYVLRRQPKLAGVIATSPGLRPGFEPPAWKVGMARTLRRVWPRLTLSNELETAAMSREAAVVAAYRADPLNHDRLSAAAGVDILDSGAWALAHAAEFPLPLLLMHGAADRVTSVEATREFAAQAGANCTLKIWDGLYHEIHNEPEQGAVLAYLIAWLDGLSTR